MSTPKLDAVVNPLTYDICRYDKLRIEGHVGMSVDRAVEQLLKLRQAFNLDFDIIALNADDSSRTVFLPDDSKVADLQASYLACRNEFVCCATQLLNVLRRLEVSRAAADGFIRNVGANADNSESGKAMEFFLSSQASIGTTLELYIKTLTTMSELLPLDLKRFEPIRFAEAHRVFLAMSMAFKVWMCCIFGLWKTRLVAAAGIREAQVRLVAIQTEVDGADEHELIAKMKKHAMGLEPLEKSANSVDLGKGTSAAASALTFICMALKLLEMSICRLTDDCVAAKFETFYRGLVNRVSKISAISRFASAHPGMEHIAGTNRGGTFILVYREEREFRELALRIKNNSNRLMREEPLEVDFGDKTIAAITGADGLLRVRLPADVGEIRIFRDGFNIHNVALADVAGNNEVRFEPTSDAGLRELANDGDNPVRALSAQMQLLGKQIESELTGAQLVEQDERALLESLGLIDAGEAGVLTVRERSLRDHR